MLSKYLLLYGLILFQLAFSPLLLGQSGNCLSAFIPDEPVEEPQKASTAIANVWEPTGRAGALLLVNGRLYRVLDHLGLEDEPVTAASRNNVVEAVRIPDGTLGKRPLDLSAFDYHSGDIDSHDSWLAGVSDGQLFVGSEIPDLEEGEIVGQRIERYRTTPDDLFQEIRGREITMVPVFLSEILNGDSISSVHWAARHSAYTPIAKTLYLYAVTSSGRVILLSFRPQTSQDGKIDLNHFVELPKLSPGQAIVPLTEDFTLRVDSTEARLWNGSEAIGSALKLPDGLQNVIVKAVPAVPTQQDSGNIVMEDLQLWAAGTRLGKPALYTWRSATGWVEIHGFDPQDQVLDIAVSWTTNPRRIDQLNQSFSQTLSRGNVDDVFGIERTVVIAVRPNPENNRPGYVLLGVHQNSLVDLPWYNFTEHGATTAMSDSQGQRSMDPASEWSIPSSRTPVVGVKITGSERWADLVNQLRLREGVPGPNDAPVAQDVFNQLYLKELALRNSMYVEDKENAEYLARIGVRNSYMVAGLARHQIAVALTFQVGETIEWISKLKEQNLPFHWQWLLLATFQQPQLSDDPSLKTVLFPRIGGREWETLVEVLKLPPAEAFNFLTADLDSQGEAMITAGRRPGEAPGNDFWSVQRRNRPEYWRKRFAIQSVLAAVDKLYGFDTGTMHNVLVELYGRGRGTGGLLPEFTLPQSSETELQLNQRAAEEMGTPETFADAVFYGIKIIDPGAREAFSPLDLEN